MTTTRVLFVCEYNACRSQMAEGLARALWPTSVEVVSAGVHPGSVNGLTIEVMREVGIDLSSHRSKGLATVADRSFDHLIILAAPAVSPATQLITAAHTWHWLHPDPVAVPRDPETMKAAIRVVRDAIRAQVAGFVAEVT